VVTIRITGFNIIKLLIMSTVFHIVTHMTVATQRFSEHVSEVTQPTVGPPLLSSRSLGMFLHNGQNTNNKRIITNCSRWWSLFGSPEVIK
jgi:hypothetical protein